MSRPVFHFDISQLNSAGLIRYMHFNISLIVDPSDRGKRDFAPWVIGNRVPKIKLDKRFRVTRILWY